MIKYNRGISQSGATPGALNSPQEFINGIKITDGTEASGAVLTSDVNGLASWQANATSQIVLSSFDPSPSRLSSSKIHGAFENIASGETISSGSPLVVVNGASKLVFVVNAGTDLVGEISVQGTKIDRNTGALTPGNIETVTINGLTIDTSTTDINGHTVHDYSNAYITGSWYTGSVTLTTTDLNISDIDVYFCSFEQFNDVATYTLTTFDSTIKVTNAAAEYDAYLYSIQVTGSTCVITTEAELHVGSGGLTSVVNKDYRLRRGTINKVMDGGTDGVWVELYYANTPAHVEDVNVKVWATIG